VRRLQTLGIGVGIRKLVTIIALQPLRQKRRRNRRHDHSHGGTRGARGAPFEHVRSRRCVVRQAPHVGRIVDGVGHLSLFVRSVYPLDYLRYNMHVCGQVGDIGDLFDFVQYLVIMRQANNVTPLFFFFVEYESKQQLDVMYPIDRVNLARHVYGRQVCCCESVTRLLRDGYRIPRANITQLTTQIIGQKKETPYQSWFARRS